MMMTDEGIRVITVPHGGYSKYVSRYYGAAGSDMFLAVLFTDVLMSIVNVLFTVVYA